MSDFAIRVENLSKRYRIGHLQHRHDTIRDVIVSAFKRSKVPAFTRSNDDLIWALKDVSFEVKRGEVVGIISKTGTVTYFLPHQKIELLTMGTKWMHSYQ